MFELAENLFTQSLMANISPSKIEQQKEMRACWMGDEDERKWTDYNIEVNMGYRISIFDR